MTPVQQLAACERTFRRYGLPLLVHGHSSRRDVFGRAAPFLLVVLLLEVIGAIKLDWPVWVNVAVLVGAMVALSAGYVGLNVARRRSWSILPQDVGRPELAFFVLAPAILPVLSGGQWRTGLAIAVGNVVLLGLVRAVVGYGLPATLWWGLSRVGTELGSSLLAHPIPAPAAHLLDRAVIHHRGVAGVRPLPGHLRRHPRRVLHPGHPGHPAHPAADRDAGDPRPGEA